MTIPVEDGRTRHAYVCQPLEVDETAAGFFATVLDVNLAQARLECDCTADPEDQASCEADLALFEAIAPVVEGCLDEVIAVAGPIPSAAARLASYFAERAGAARFVFRGTSHERSRSAASRSARSDASVAHVAGAYTEVPVP